MKTIERMKEECGIRKIAKLINENGSLKNEGNTKRLEESDINRIEKLIDDCCYAISNDDASDSTLKKLADALRRLFESDGCIIGKVVGDFLEQCVVSWVNTNKENKYIIQKRNLKDVKRVKLDKQNSFVSKGLNSEDYVTHIDKIKEIEDYSVYKKILGEVRNTTIIPIRDKSNTNKGFIQLFNSKYRVYSYDIKQLFDSLLRLILLIHQQDELKDAKLFKQDSEFLSRAQKKLDNVDLLLEDIMEYLSKEFSAGVVTYRIPLLVGTKNEPLFFLRDCYIRDEIAKYYSKDDYFRDRLVRTVIQMGGYDKLIMFPLIETANIMN